MAAGGKRGWRAREERNRAAATGSVVLALVVVLAAVLLVVGRSTMRAEDEGIGALERSFRRTIDRATLSYETTLTVDRDDTEQHLTVAASTDVTTAAVHGTVALGSGTEQETQLDFRVQGRRLFLQRAGTPADEAWSEVDLLETLATSQDEDVGLLGLAVQRPVEFLSMLRGVQSTDEVGTDLLDGIPTTHYVATLSFDAALDTPNQLTDVDLLRSVTERIDGDEIQVDAWIDDNGKLRQLALDGTLDGGADYQLVLRISAFGETLDPTLPSETTVITPIDLGELVRG